MKKTIRNNIKTYKNITKTATGRRDDYTANRLLDYFQFKAYCKLIAMHLTKQQAFDADLETKKQISFTGKLDQAEDTKIVFILEEIKETILEFSQGTVRVL